MQSTDQTKYRFADAIMKLMKSEPLEKITVRGIVKKAGMTRQTFYRNFRDKYDLVHWYFDVLTQTAFNQLGEHGSLQEGLNAKLHFIAKINYYIKCNT